MSIGRFLAGIGVLIWHPATQTYLLLRRGGHRDFGAGQWECVAGRVDQGESFGQALAREVWEEIGVSVQFEFFLATTHFYRGPAQPENELVGILCCCALEDRAALRVSDEHSEHHWLTAPEALALLPEGHWLAAVIKRAERIRALAPPELRDVWRQMGLELGDGR